MRNGLKSFKEFHQVSGWREYVDTYMTNTKIQNFDTEVKVLTKRGEVIAVWQKHGYGYVEECRSSERLTAQLAA